MSTTLPGATITDTLTGADPVETSSTIASGGTLVAGNSTLKAKAWKAEAGQSPTGHIAVGQR